MSNALRLSLLGAATCLAASAAPAQSRPEPRPTQLAQHSPAASPDTSRAAPKDGTAPRDTTARDTTARDTTTRRAPAPAAPAQPTLLPGAGTIRINGLLQAWYMTHTTSSRSSFRLRRAELRLNGDLGRRVGWALGIDAAKALSVTPTYVTVNGQRVLADETVNLASQILQDAMVTVHAPAGISIDVGQTKVPLSFAGMQGSGRLETVERPMFAADRARGGAFGDVRDVGVLVRGSTLGHVDYSVGAFNGSGESQNGIDRNDQKSLAGRVVLRALVPGLQVGASGVYGGRPSADYARRDRLGAEAQYAAGPIVARSEFMSGTDGATHRAGYYGLTSVRARRGVDLVARYDVWDPDTHNESSAATARATDVLGGVNLALGGSNSAVQIDYQVRSFHGHLAPRASQLLLNVQTSW
ncbi:porin [Roseisolibacter agri]|nr:porin [Roseisolibacter agri]